MLSRFSRSELLFGKDGMEKLRNAHIAIFGIGGVGGYAAEAIVRTGAGHIDLIDNDTVSLTNINRQLYALTSTIGEYKVDCAYKRCKDINPDAEINTYKVFYTPETSQQFDFTKYDYIIDAIDTVSGKIELIVNANEVGTPIISSMGAGNKLDPTQFEVADIYKTSVCPLAKVMRRELKKRNIPSLKVVYSKEMPAVIKSDADMIMKEENISKRQIPASNAFVPSVAGLIIAGEVIKDIVNS